MKNCSASNILLFSNRIEIKPLSVNKCWQGKRFKTTDYLAYEKELLYTLPPFDLKRSTDPLHVNILLGVSNLAFDVDNAVKPLLDVLQKKYNFDDRYIFRLIVEKVLVRKGFEFIEFNIKKYQPFIETLVEDES
jgi:hypothetical protein